jgi:hypothetical protein
LFIEKDLAGGIDESQRQKRFDFSELFQTLIPNLSSVYSKSGFVDENGGLTEKGASHILHLLRNTTPGGVNLFITLSSPVSKAEYVDFFTCF